MHTVYKEEICMPYLSLKAKEMACIPYLSLKAKEMAVIKSEGNGCSTLLLEGLEIEELLLLTF